VRVVTLDIRVIFLSDFVEGALPEIEREGQHVGFAAERQLLFFVAFAGEVESIAQAALDSGTSADACLQRNFVGRAFVGEPARAGVKPFIIFTHNHEVNVFGFLVLERTEALVVKLDRPQVDVLFQFEADAQQDALFQYARLHVRVADGTQ